MIKTREVAFASENLKNSFDKLKEGKFQEKELSKFLIRTIDDLKENPSCGIKIPKKLWPKKYLQKYSITNLFKYNLPNSWRLVYTIREDEITILSVLLDWMPHKDYERTFNY